MRAFLRKFEILTEAEISELIELASIRKLKKGDFFIGEGKVCSEVAFIQSGSLRSYYVPESGEEMTYCISFPDTFMTAYSSYLTGNPSLENIQAMTPAELWVISKKDIDSFSEKHVNGLKLQKYIAEQQYMELERRVFLYQQQTAKMRYKELTANYPEFIGQLPVQYLASYLGISPRHLSRLRKEVLFESQPI